MVNVTYNKQLTALVVIDPYNDFLSEGGKIWDRIRAVAEANECIPHMLQVLNAARKAELRLDPPSDSKSSTPGGYVTRVGNVWSSRFNMSHELVMFGRRVSCAISRNDSEPTAKRANYVGTCREAEDICGYLANGGLPTQQRPRSGKRTVQVCRSHEVPRHSKKKVVRKPSAAWCWHRRSCGSLIEVLLAGEPILDLGDHRTLK
jgi:hypothetical protein